MGVAEFTKSFIGYNKSEVKKQIQEMKKIHDEFLSEKQKEINDFRKKIANLEESNYELLEKIEDENKERDKFFNLLNKEISRIESQVVKRQDEVDVRNNLALDRLIKKKNNLLEIQSYIKELQKNLEMIKEDSELVEKLYD